MNAAQAASITTPQDPATGAGREPITATKGDHGAADDGLAAALGDAPMAVVVTVITADRITQRAHLHMGGIQGAARDWHRTGKGSWRTTDPEFIEAEDRLGVELAEYMDALDLPSRVANMLPGRPANTSSVAFRQAMAAAEELRHG